MGHTWHDGYKHIKEKFDYIYKGYNLKYLVPGYLSLDFWATPNTCDLLKRFYLSAKVTNFSQLLELSQTTLISYLINRTDYADLANATGQDYEDAKVINLSLLPIKSISPFNPSYIKHFWLAFWLVYSRAIGFNFKYKLHFWAITTMLLNQIYQLDKIKRTHNTKRYVCFNSAFKEESFLTLYFKKRKIETISMQHGIFCDFKCFVPFDIINLENCIADKVLCWGQSTVDYLSTHGFDRSQLILTGNPKYKDVKPIETIDQTFDCCLVLLGRETYIGTNNKLLDLLKEYNKRHQNTTTFYIKKHPFLNDQTHKEYADIESKFIFLGKEHSVKEILKSDLINFCIAVNTTAYYEALTLGKPCLRWSEEENEEFCGMDDKFENMDELESKITCFKQMDGEELKKRMTRIIEFVFKPA